MKINSLQSLRNLIDVVLARLGSFATTALFFLSVGATLGKSDIKVAHSRVLTESEQSILEVSWNLCVMHMKHSYGPLVSQLGLLPVCQAKVSEAS